MGSPNKGQPKSTSSGDNPTSPTKPISLDILNGDQNGSGPGAALQENNISTAIVFEASSNDTLHNGPRSSSPRKSPAKQPPRTKNDRPPQNSRALSPKKSKNYLDYDGEDSDEENDGALAQVYDKGWEKSETLWITF